MDSEELKRQIIELLSKITNPRALNKIYHYVKQILEHQDKC
ncbi:MAG: hypothetical protein ACOX6P_11355 [Candidatus Merdivicinus sp.]|jgi:hypothetical protein